MRYIQPENRSQYVMMNTPDDLVPGDHIKTATKLFRQFLHAHGYIKGAPVALDESRG